MFVYLAIALVHIHVSYIGYPGYLPLFVDYTWRTSASCRFCTLKVISWISANNSRDSEIIPWWFCMISWESSWTMEDLMWRWQYDKLYDQERGGRFKRGEFNWNFSHGTLKIDFWKRRFLLETGNLGYPLVKFQGPGYSLTSEARSHVLRTKVSKPWRQPNKTQAVTWWWFSGLDLFLVSL